MSTTARPPRTALVAMAAGPGRASVVRVLRAEGLRVRTASNSYRGVADFSLAPTDAVVFSVEGLRVGVASFVRTLRRRSRDAVLVAVVPMELRRFAVRALDAGADAHLLEPWYPEELRAIVRRLPAPRTPRRRGAPADALPRLAEEVAHAVNNPLQVLTLHMEAGGVPPATAAALREEIARIREVVGWLDRFSRTGRWKPVATRVGPLLDGRLDEAQDARHVERFGHPVAMGPVVQADPDLLSAAFGSLLLLIAARLDGGPRRVAGRVREGRGVSGPYVQASLRAPTLHLDATAIRDLRSAVFVSDDRTRRSYPGLALPEAVAVRHGGRLVARDTPKGLVLGLRLPIPPPARTADGAGEE